jgi:hypothetical protein
MRDEGFRMRGGWVAVVGVRGDTAGREGGRLFCCDVEMME